MSLVVYENTAFREALKWLPYGHIQVFVASNMSDNPFPDYANKLIYGIAMNSNYSAGVRIIATVGEGSVQSSVITI